MITLILSSLSLDFFSQNSIILKINPLYKDSCTKNEIKLISLNTLLSNYSFQLKQLFPKAYMPDSSYIFYPYCVDISTIYELNIYNSNNDIQEIIRKIKNLPEIVYCHLKDVPELLFTPNDPGLGSQYYLHNVKAFEAWDLYKGDSTVIIGIVDTGIESAHDDLWVNIAYNYQDPLDGIDNDGDGFVDNFRGWDMGNNDNSPEWSENLIGANPHGVLVAGMATPTTNNNIGIAGLGFKTKFLPIKIIDSMGVLSRSYEGIVYAADHGCKIINCSWGSTIPSDFGYDVIRYATYNRGCLIFAAAGNNGHTANSIYYPAAYPEVVCVTATNQYDTKWNKACYGYHVDVCSPGENVYSTYSNNGYTFGWGTSYASPLAASAAALVYGYYQKLLNPFQLKSIIEINTDVVDTIPANLPFYGKMGKGRINALKALSQNINKAVQLFNYQFEEQNDTLFVSFSLINLFKPLQNLQLSIFTNEPYLSPLNNLNLGQLDSLAIVGNQTAKFKLKISPYCPIDYELEIFINVQDSGYNDIFYYRTTINKSYKNIFNNKILLTVCSNGKVGYNSFSPIQGTGIHYWGSSSVISDMGLFVLSKNKASWSFSTNNDYTTLQKVKVSNEALFTSGESIFSDYLNQQALGIEVLQKITLYNADSVEDIIHFQYKVKNTTQTTLDSAFIGLYSDVDLYNSQKNLVRFDSLLKLLYVYAPYITGNHCGFLLPDKYKSKRYYAADNNGINQSINSDDGITLNELKQVVKQNRFEAGNTSGNDVSVFVAYGPITIPAQDSVECEFVMVFGKNYNELIKHTLSAMSLFDTTIYVTSLQKNNPILYPNPTDGMLCFSQKLQKVMIIIYNQHGKIVEQKYYDNLKCFSIQHLPNNLYWVQIISNNKNVIEKVIKK